MILDFYKVSLGENIWYSLYRHSPNKACRGAIMYGTVSAEWLTILFFLSLSLKNDQFAKYRNVIIPGSFLTTNLNTKEIHLSLQTSINCFGATNNFKYLLFLILGKININLIKFTLLKSLCTLALSSPSYFEVSQAQGGGGGHIVPPPPLHVYVYIFYVYNLSFCADCHEIYYRC